MNEQPEHTIPGAANPTPELSQLLEEQRQRWEGGEHVLVELLLPGYASLQSNPDALLDLIYQELMLREEHKDSFTLEEYLRRFPHLEKPLRLMFEVDEALQRGSLARPTDVPEKPAGTVVDRIGPPQPGRREYTLADYEILSVLGEGGMGIVYKARQISLNRLVALKMIRGNPGPAERARFHAEAQAVARLEHPNIVHVFEVGESDGQPYFSLEFVAGGNLAAFLDRTPQPAAEAAQLVETLARAVHYAHQQGVVHRDLKPANILLQEFSPRGTEDTQKTKTPRPASKPANASSSSVSSVPLWFNSSPKITDFGLAKFVAEDSSNTRTGAVMGTPSYMAPEQAEGRKAEIGPLVDVYALGAILYECLTGRPPFRGTSVLDTLHQVRFDEPVRPSLLRRGCPRDLETICLKCLRKEPAKRYSTALALAEDLQRFRTGRTILARPAGPVERTLKWARRQPTAALALAVLVVLGVGGWWAALALGESARRERQLHNKAEKSFGDALEAVDQLLEEVAESDLADVPLMEQVRRKLLRKASGFYQRFLGQRGGDPAVREQAGRAYSRLGDIHELLNEDEEAEQAYRQAVDLLRKWVQEAPTATAARRELARALNNQGNLFKKGGRYAAAETALREALQQREQLADADPDLPDGRRDRAETQYFLGALLAPLKGREQEADEAYRQALDTQKQLATLGRPEYRRDLARTCNNRGRLLWQTGQQKEARQVFEEAEDAWRQLVRDHPTVPGYRLQLARALNNRIAALGPERRPDAERGAREVKKILGDLVADFPTVSLYRQELATVSNNLALWLREQRRPADAEAALRGILGEREKLARTFPQIPDYRHKLARTLLDLGNLLHDSRPWEAEQFYRASRTIQEQLVADFPENADYEAGLLLTLDKMGRLLLKRGKLGELCQGARLLLPCAGDSFPVDLGVLAQAHAALVEAGGCRDLAIKHKEAGPQTPIARRALAGLYQAAADIRVHLGQHVRVAAAAEQFPRLLPADRNEYLRAAQFLAKCVTLAGEDFDLAPQRRRALRETYGRKAVEMLRQAKDRGLKDANQLRIPVYEPLLQREDFKKLLKDLEESRQRPA